MEKNGMERDKNNCSVNSSDKPVGFVFVRLGQDSGPEIEMLDAGTTKAPFEISVKCKQVPATAVPNDIVIIYLGSNNNKGIDTPWVKGLRAIGRLSSITGGPRHNDEKTVCVRVELILPRSLGKKEITDQEIVPYRLLSEMPVVGINNYSSQVVQCVDSADSSQNIGALLAVVGSLFPGFAEELTVVLPEAAHLMNAYGKQSVRAGSWRVEPSAFGDLCGLVDMEEAAFRAFAALRAGVHVIFTGPPGTGKTKLAECICRTAGFASWTVPATDQWTTFETIGGYFPSPIATPSDDSNAPTAVKANESSDANSPAQSHGGETSGAETPIPQATAASYGTDRLDFLPGAIVDSIQRGQCVIIDEINRADIDKAFGELFTLLAGNSVTLPFRRRSDAGFRRIRLVVDNAPPEAGIDDIPVPQWWRIIGASNVCQWLSYDGSPSFQWVVPRGPSTKGCSVPAAKPVAQATNPHARRLSLF
jgi:MoxR-like ATPase